MACSFWPKQVITPKSCWRGKKKKIFKRILLVNGTYENRWESGSKLWRQSSWLSCTQENEICNEDIRRELKLSTVTDEVDEYKATVESCGKNDRWQVTKARALLKTESARLPRRPRKRWLNLPDRNKWRHVNHWREKKMRFQRVLSVNKIKIRTHEIYSDVINIIYVRDNAYKLLSAWNFHAVKITLC